MPNQSPLIPHVVKHFKEFHYGVNWTWANLNETLNDITWDEATHQIPPLHTILALTYHIHYYYVVATKVLKGGPLVGSDKVSFDHPEVESEADWQALITEIFAQADTFISELSQMDEQTLWNQFGSDGKYGDYYRNIMGTLEHGHYHLGQIVIIKKLLRYPSS